RGYRNRAAIYALRGDAGHAIADADEAIRLDPKNAFAFNIRGKAYFDKGQYALAIIDYDQAIRLDPLLSEARQNRERAQAAVTQPQPSQGLREPFTPPSAETKPPQPASPSAPAERRVALVIGNSQYRSVPVLPNPRRDAEAVTEALRRAGFEAVELAIDLDRDAMAKAL